MLPKVLRRIPIAWFQLNKDKSRLLVALAGIAFADMLMFIQLGILDALFDGATQVHRNLKADLVLINPKFQTLFYPKYFPKERLQQVLAYEGVKAIRPLYIDIAQWRNPESRFSYGIMVWGIDPANTPFNFPEINKNLEQIKPLDRVMFDRASRPSYGPIPALVQQKTNVATEVNDKNVQVVGLFTLGASFGANGNIITSDSTFLHLFPTHRPNDVAIGLVELEPDADKEQVKLRLQGALSNNVRVATPTEFAQTEIEYWANQGIGFIFGMGVVVGFVVGIVIVYQILYSGVSEHLPEYATLKAMGYSNRYLLVVLMQEALILAVLGYIPGFLLSFGLYQITHAATLMPVTMKLGRAGLILALTIIMCSVSGAIAVRKLQSADPADIFS